MNRRERRRQERLGGEAEITSDKAKNTARARVRAAEIKLKEGDDAGARDALREAQTLDPENSRAWYVQAMLDFNAGRLDEAADAIVNAATNEETDPAVHANCAAIMNVCDRPMEAEAAARFALELDPEMPEAFCNLGVALEAQGKVPEARESLVAAIARKPDYFEAMISLGNLSFRSGDYMAAVEMFADAVRSAPHHAMARTNLGIALRYLGELSTAEQQCLEAIALDPNYAEAHNALGNVRLQRGDLPGAVKSFEEAVSRRQNYAEAMSNLAAAHFKSGDYAAAERAFVDVIDVHPTFAEAAHGLGVVLLAQGRTDDALRRFRKAVELRPGYGEAWMNIIDADPASLSEEDVETLREKFDDARLPEEDRMAFCFALGAAEEAQGNFSAAAAAFQSGNARRRDRAAREELLFDADAFDAEVASVKDLFSKQAMEGLRGLGDPEAKLVFVCGMPRSGTTLVAQTLAAHSDVHGVGEVDVLSGLMDSFPASLGELTSDDVRDMADTYIRRLPRQPRDGTLIVDKTPQNVFFLGLAQVLFPASVVVHCRREMRDVALSCYLQAFKAGGLDWASDIESIRRYALAEQGMMDHWRDHMSLPILDVAYEDMVTDHEKMSRDLAKFLGITWQPEMATPHKSSGAVLTASNWQVRKPVYNSSVGRWRKYADYLDFSAFA